MGWDFSSLFYAKWTSIGFGLVARADLIMLIGVTADTNYLL